ncbi:uncharacterized protein DEA37_0013190 [Paragonimus westermani]|uniref:Uncharacterized protein n=1 Tax=Paragonimus westermani TaxID=34504 RepID=A0A5J4NHR6_9TREM|nr:uncharacterized protein DEA37_0013190 [Paragonimus westermani]
MADQLPYVSRGCHLDQMASDVDVECSVTSIYTRPASSISLLTDRLKLSSLNEPHTADLRWTTDDHFAVQSTWVSAPCQPISDDDMGRISHTMNDGTLPNSAPPLTTYHVSPFVRSSLSKDKQSSHEKPRTEREKNSSGLPNSLLPNPVECIHYFSILVITVSTSYRFHIWYTKISSLVFQTRNVLVEFTDSVKLRCTTTSPVCQRNPWSEPVSTRSTENPFSTALTNPVPVAPTSTTCVASLTAALAKPCSAHSPGCHLWAPHCASNGCHIPAKRACRSLSASSSILHPMVLGLTCSNLKNDAALLEAHRKSLPRPVAVRLTSLDKVSPTGNASMVSNPTQSATTGVAVRLRPREVNHASRLSWHHPLFSTGVGLRSQHPSYGVHFVCTSPSGPTSHVNQRRTTSKTVSTKFDCGLSALGDHNSSTTNVMLSTTNSNGTAQGHKSAECPCQSFSRISSVHCCSSAFTPTQTCLDSPRHNPVPSFGSFSSSNPSSPDADADSVSCSSSFPFPVPTPSSGFHEASFSYFSEASSLPDCSKTIHFLYPFLIRTHAFILQVDFPADLYTCSNTHITKLLTSNRVVSSNAFKPSSVIDELEHCALHTCSSSLKPSVTHDSIVRCRSQPSALAVQFMANRAVCTHSKEVGLDSKVGPLTAGFKRRRGPSGTGYTSECPTGSELQSICVFQSERQLPHHWNSTTIANASRAHPSSLISVCTDSAVWSSTTTDRDVSELFVFGSGVPVSSDSSPPNYRWNPAIDGTLLACNRRSQNDSYFVRLPRSISSTDSVESSNPNGVNHHWPTSIACDEPLSPAFSAFDPDVSSVCRRTCVHLGDLSESVEEEKDYETPETMTEEATSLSDSNWQRSKHLTITSPSIYEVTFAPIQPSHDNETEETELEFLDHENGDSIQYGTSRHQKIGDDSVELERSNTTSQFDLTSVQATDSSCPGVLIPLSDSSSDSNASDEELTAPSQLFSRCHRRDRYNSCTAHSVAPALEIDLELMENN